MPCSPKRAVSETICCISVDIRRLPFGQSPHNAPVIPKRMSESIGSRDLDAEAPHAFEAPRRLAATAVPDNVSAEETNSRLLRRRSLFFPDTAISFPVVLAGLRPVETMFHLFADLIQKSKAESID